MLIVLVGKTMSGLPSKVVCFVRRLQRVSLGPSADMHGQQHWVQDDLRALCGLRGVLLASAHDMLVEALPAAVRFSRVHASAPFAPRIDVEEDEEREQIGQAIDHRRSGQEPAEVAVEAADGARETSTLVAKAAESARAARKTDVCASSQTMRYQLLRSSGPSFAIRSYSLLLGFFFCGASADVAPAVANLAPLGDERAV